MIDSLARRLALGALVAAADRGTPATAPTAPPTPDWDALDDALASAAQRGNGLTTRLQDWLDEEVHLSRRACFGYTLVIVVVVVLSVAVFTTRTHLNTIPNDDATSAPVEDPVEPKDNQKAPNRTVF